MTIKVTFIFSAFKYSWSEAHYLISANSFTDAIFDASNLAMLRQGLLGTNAYLTNVRLSNYPANRLTYDLIRSSWPSSGALQTYTGEEETTDSPFSAILVAMTTATARRNLYLAGVPDVDIQWTSNSPNGYLPSGGFSNAFTNYMQTLIGNIGPAGNWGTRVDDSGFGTPVTAVQNQIGFGNDVGVLTDSDPALTVGKPAKLFGFRTINPRIPNLTGSYDVLKVMAPGSGSSSWTTILARTSGVEGTNFSVYGTISPKGFAIEPYNSYNLVRVTHRKRGASYGKPVGKSLVRR